MQLIKIKVKTEQKKPGVIILKENEFEIKVKAKKERGLANREALALLAQHLKKPLKSLRIIKGQTSPNKIICILD